ncbi:hypothetical protein KC326_g54 [Hortaea werneckii]|nr:hypothetical protein KC326_g54 [Hortaea werneckii]
MFIITVGFLALYTAVLHLGCSNASSSNASSSNEILNYSIGPQPYGARCRLHRHETVGTVRQYCYAESAIQRRVGPESANNANELFAAPSCAQGEGWSVNSHILLKTFVRPPSSAGLRDTRPSLFLRPPVVVLCVDVAANLPSSSQRRTQAQREHHSTSSVIDIEHTREANKPVTSEQSAT